MGTGSLGRAGLIQALGPMTIRHAIRRKVIAALMASALCITLLLVLIQFFAKEPWAWIGIFLMIGAIAPMFYAVWLVDCPKCRAIFGQQNVFNVAFNLTGKARCPHCGVDLDGSLPGA